MRNRATTPLKKPTVRQSWSKYNLYNLSRLVAPSYKTKTFFQQKWSSKSVLRAYHGEQVREGQWERMFSRKLRSVIPMNPAYLARNDGSVESAGRGSGLRADSKERVKDRPKIPFHQMTFAPLERRLDTAIFRALFASSARQARQFVVHGAVKVNGKRMRFPGYLLNPGDMFQVEPERVMYATGAPKQPIEKKSEDADAAEAPAEAEASAEAEVEAAEEEVEEPEREPREVLKDLLSQSKSILASPRSDIGAKRKQDLRAFSKSVKRVLSRSQSSTILSDSLEAQFIELQNQLQISRESRKKRKESALAGQNLEGGPVGADNEATQGAETPVTQTLPESQTEEEEESRNYVSRAEYNDLLAALEITMENPIDESKPYATPWMPREYMSAFAFVPRYLEVNHSICAAVYLRHPVARPGEAEVPSPYGDATSTGAFTWYLRRR